MKLDYIDAEDNEIAPSSERCLELWDEVLKTLNKFTVQELKELSVIELIQKLNIYVIPFSNLTVKEFTDLKSIAPTLWDEGLCWDSGKGKMYIYYNDKLDSGKTSIVLFHELAHLLLNHTQQSAHAEAEAFFFAGFCLGTIEFIKRNKQKEAA